MTYPVTKTMRDSGRPLVKAATLSARAEGRDSGLHALDVTEAAMDDGYSDTRAGGRKAGAFHNEPHEPAFIDADFSTITYDYDAGSAPTPQSSFVDLVESIIRRDGALSTFSQKF